MKIEFNLPAGLHLPDGVAEGGTFDVSAKLQVKEGGKVCLVELDGMPMPGYADGDDEDEKKPFTKRVMEGASQYGSPTGETMEQ
jgi:hypothetical protein